MAEVDLERMNQYKTIIMKVARAKKMDPAVIAGIISRETRAGSCGSGLVDGWGDKGNAFGLMQVCSNNTLVMHLSVVKVTHPYYNTVVF